ncbi:MAG: efflux RND transporter periplasmic adaptor subunit [Burkholderiales bacterium]|nr:efflux RND transporter periplasmic adaptor subunit [Burkholderiales bacterium]
MRTRNIVLIIVLLLVAVVGARFWFKAKAPANPAPASAAAAKTSAPTALEFLASEVVTTEPTELRQVMQLTGTLRAVDQVTVKAKVAAEVREVMVREGESVKAGQVVVKLDTSEYEARVAQARGNLNNARAQMEIATKARDNNLVLVEKGFISKNAFDNSASQYAAAKASVDSAQGALDIVLKSLNDTVSRAAISGLVSVRHVQPGEKVAMDSRLLEIVNLQQLELEAAVPSSEISKVAIGQKVELRIEGLSQRFDGKVVRINPATQAGSRSVPVYVQIANPQNLLRVGMFADGRLLLSSKAGVVTLPQSAVRKVNDGSFVFAIVNNKIERLPVTLGSTGLVGDDHHIEITSGLEFGAQVIRADMGNLTPGTPVRVNATPKR